MILLIIKNKFDIIQNPNQFLALDLFADSYSEIALTQIMDGP